MASIEGENMPGVTWCVLEEVNSDDWGIAGNPLSTQDEGPRRDIARRMAEPGVFALRIGSERR